MKDIMGYSINMIRLLIGQCAQAWNLQSSPPLKSRGVGGNSGLQAKPFFILNMSYKQQATSQEATSNKWLLGVLDNLIIRLYKIVKERIKI